MLTPTIFRSFPGEPFAIASSGRLPLILLLAIAPLFAVFNPRSGLGQTGVAARVATQEIRIKRLKPQVDRVLARTPATGRKLEIIKAQVLEENIKQRLVNMYLQGSQYKATQNEIELEFVNLKKEIESEKKSLPDLLKQRGINEQQLRESIAWDLSWGKYLDNFLTEENLGRYFEKHRHQFDGTQLRVAHILIKPEDSSAPDSWKKALQVCQKVHSSVQKGELEFDDAVIQFSAGATKVNKGDLGWISWQGPMAPAFTVAAFQLTVNEISEPVETSFGYHLIKLLESKPGNRKLDDIRPALLRSVKRYLFEWLAAKQADSTPIHFTGEFPHFKYGTKILGPSKTSDHQSPTP